MGLGSSSLGFKVQKIVSFFKELQLLASTNLDHLLLCMIISEYIVKYKAFAFYYVT